MDLGARGPCGCLHVGQLINSHTLRVMTAIGGLLSSVMTALAADSRETGVPVLGERARALFGRTRERLRFVPAVGKEVEKLRFHALRDGRFGPVWGERSWLFGISVT